MKKILESGQTIVEVLIALTIAVMIISSVVAVVLSALKGAEVSKQRTQASLLSQEAIEIVRQLRNTDYAGFCQKNGTYCLDKDSSTLRSANCSATTANVDVFVRQVTIQQPSPCTSGTASVSATVYWKDSNCVSGIYCHSVNLVTKLENFTPVTAP